MRGGGKRAQPGQAEAAAPPPKKRGRPSADQATGKRARSTGAHKRPASSAADSLASDSMPVEFEELLERKLRRAL